MSRVNYLKHGPDKNFAVIDAAMNDLIRPSLYGAWQEIIRVDEQSGAEEKVYDVVGAISATVGAMAALEGIKILSKTGRPMWNQMLTYDGFNGRQFQIELQQRSDCPCCGSGGVE